MSGKNINYENDSQSLCWKLSDRAQTFVFFWQILMEIN